jgi:hypothetical protein
LNGIDSEQKIARGINFELALKGLVFFPRAHSPILGSDNSFAGINRGSLAPSLETNRNKKTA